MRRIVVVEDSPTQAARLRVLLEREGWSVRVARDGLEGLSVCEKDPPDIVLSDIVMPGIDGFELCRRLASTPALAAIPVVLLTSLSAPSDVVHALGAGAANYVTKPYEDRELIARLDRTLHRRSSGAEVEVLGERVRIDAHPDRILDVLVSALEDARRRAEEIEGSRRALAKSEAENRRLYEEAMRASRAKDEFLAVVSHELRTPLSAITGWSRLLREGGLDDAGRVRALETIERNAFAQARLVEDVLDVSRITAGKLAVEQRDLELAPLVASAVASFEPAAAAKGVRLVRCLPEGGLRMRGDPDRLNQVACNLIGNALKFTERAKRVEVVLVRSGAQARLEVCDEGRGIEPEFIPHVFEPFRQADSSTARRQGGLGLGLAIARRIVETHGGTIRAESEGLGRGARFVVLLPLDESEAARAPGEEPAAGAAPNVLEGLRILAVDDDEDARELLRIALEQRGARVEIVASPDEVVHALSRTPFDVLVSDVGMPGEDGYALLRRLRRELPQRSFAAVALTAFGGRESERASIDAGYDVHVTKPAPPPVLSDAIARALERKRRS